MVRDRGGGGTFSEQGDARVVGLMGVLSHLAVVPVACSSCRRGVVRGVADRAGQGPVRVKPFLRRGLLGHIEFSGNILAVPEVHLVRSLASEGGVGETLVVLGRVEGDELADGLDAVERVQEQPVVLRRPPPRLDHGVGAPQLGHGQDPAEQAGVDDLGAAWARTSRPRRKAWTGTRW